MWGRHGGGHHIQMPIMELPRCWSAPPGILPDQQQLQELMLAEQDAKRRRPAVVLDVNGNPVVHMRPRFKCAPRERK